MAMNGRSNGRVGGVLLLLVAVLVFLANSSVNAQYETTYSCLGGCYNQCFPTISPIPTSPDCYYKCFGGCVTRTPADYKDYCVIGCSLKRCVAVAIDGAKLESCFGLCNNICKSLMNPGTNL